MKLVPTLAGLLLLVAVGIGANALVAARTDPAGEEQAQTARPLPVETSVLARRDRVDVRRTFTGSVDARRHAELAFEGSGRVARVHVEDGDRVEAGAVLAELDTEQLVAQRAEIESRRVRLQAQLDELLAGPREEVIEAARSDVTALEEELALARLQRDRRAELVARGSISSEQLDTIRTQVRTVEARLSGERARLLELENGTRAESLAAQRGAVGEVDSALASIDVRIDRARLRAPFAGTIEARYLDEGVVVSEQMPEAAFSLVESDALEARIGVPAELASRIAAPPAPGAQRPVLRLRGREIEVRSTRALPTVDAGTRTVTVVLELDDRSARENDVRPGDVVSLELRIELEESGVWIPLAALSESTRGLWSAYAAVPTETGPGTHRIERIELEVLHVDADRAYARGTIEDGLLVVISGAHRLVPGQAVVLRSEVADATSRNE